MGKEGGSPAKFRDLLDSVIIQIKKRPVMEMHRADTEDKVLIGLFSIVKTIVAQDPSLKLYVGSQKG